MNHIKSVLKYIVNITTILLVFILLIIIYGKISSLISGNKYPNYFGYTVLEVASGSMEPVLNVGDVVAVKINSDFEKDDIVAFINENSIITHRIIFIDGDVITVKGDSNNVVDKPINKDQVIGKVIKVYPKLGIMKKVFNSPGVLIMVFITLLLFDFALATNPKDKKNTKKDKPKKRLIIKEKTPDDEERDDEIVIKKIEIVNNEDNNKKLKELEITKNIDIEELNALIDEKLKESNKEEVKKIEITNKETTKEEVKTEVKEDVEDSKELDYTIRLDLNEIQNRIDKKIR